jgi:hypothetical protein
MKRRAFLVALVAAPVAAALPRPTEDDWIHVPVSVREPLLDDVPKFGAMTRLKSGGFLEIHSVVGGHLLKLDSDGRVEFSPGVISFGIRTWSDEDGELPAPVVRYDASDSDGYQAPDVWGGYGRGWQ